MLIVATSLFLDPMWVGAELQGDAALLRLAAAEYRENRERLLTWSGEAVVTRHDQLKGRRWRSSVSFAYDSATDSARWRWIFDAREDPFRPGPGDPRRHDPPAPGSVIAGILHEGQLIRLVRQADARKPSDIAIVPREHLRGLETADGYFYPALYLRELARGDWDRLWLFIADNAHNPLNTWQVERTGDLLTVGNKRGDVVNSYQLDLSCGANVIVAHYESSGVTTDIETRWKRVSDVWVPTWWSRRRVAIRDEELVENHVRAIEFAESRVNHALADNSFTIESLRLAAGDRIHDYSTREMTTYGQGSDVPMGSFPARWHWILGVNSALLLLVGISAARRYRKRRAATRS